MGINYTESHGFTDQLGNINLHKNEDIQYLEKETAIKRKIKYILENMADKEATPIARLDFVKEKLNISDESLIKNILREVYRKMYFGELETTGLIDSNKNKIVHILKRSDEDIAEIKRGRYSRNKKMKI